MGTSQNLLDQAVQEVEARRRKVLDLFDEKAYEAAQVTCDALNFLAQDQLDLSNKKLQLETADRILDIAGYKKQKVEHSGKVEFEPLKISRGEA